MTGSSLRGKTALITGASGGLGRDMARELAGRGCNLIVVARRQQKLEEVRAELEAAHGVAVHVLVADLSEPDAPEKIFAEVNQAGLRVDLLLNNAGFGQRGEFLSVPWAQHKELVVVDVLAAAQLTHLFAPGMVERGWGRVMFVASTMAYQASPGFASYGAAKGYILLLGEALAYELRKTKVRVTTVSPGMTETDFHERAGQSPTLFQRLTRMSSEETAKRCVRAMLKGTPSTLIGTQNKLVAFSGRFAPRRLAAWSTALLMRQPGGK